MSPFDYAVISLYGLMVVAIGAYVGRDRHTSSDLMLARRSVPTWAVLFSMIATELSAATFIGVPQAAYAGDWRYLQFAFGALVAKLALAIVVVPLYHRLGIVTVYGLLEIRFGRSTRRASATAFACGRVLASGVRLFIAALAFATVTELSIEIAIGLCGFLALLYTSFGGIRSVIWTDVLQGAVFVLGVLGMLLVLDERAPGGLAEIGRWGAAEGRTRIFHWRPLFDWASSASFGTAFIGGFFLTLATHATDHDMVQRLLTTRTGRQGGLALFGSGLLNFPLTLLFLFVGTGIAFVHATPPGYDISDADRILPLFALHELPSGLRGLVFAGLFAAAMSSLDSAICAIATTWVVDVLPINGASPDDPQVDRALARRMQRVSVVTGILLIAAAIAMSAYHRWLQTHDAPLSLVEFALSSMTILYGGLLGIFARAVLVPRAGRDRLGVLGLAVGSAVGLLLFLQSYLFDHVWIAWTWWIPIAAVLSFGVSALPVSQREDGSLND